MIQKQALLKSRILIVDDNPSNIAFLKKILFAEGYSSVVGITDPGKAEKIYPAFRPDLLLLDINMPHIDGYRIMGMLKKIKGTSSCIAVLALTASWNKETRIRALSEGARDFLTKPFEKIETLTRIKNIMRVKLLHNNVKNQNIILEQTIKERTLQLRTTRLEIIHRLGQAAEYRDRTASSHIVRMSHMCVRLGRLAGMTARDSDLLLDTTPMHDIGKIGIPDKILLKQGKLDREEWKIMQTHTTIGANILDDHDSELMVSARNIALSHHEKWDGSGYPLNLKNIEIPFESRITGIVDTFDALTSKRPYKDSYPTDKACAIIKKERGKHFDPELTDLFLNNIDAFIQIKNKFSNKKNIVPENFQLSERDKAGRHLQQFPTLF